MSTKTSQTALFFPRPTLVQKLVSFHVSTSYFSLAPEHLLDYHLCRDARVINARLPVRLNNELSKRKTGDCCGGHLKAMYLLPSDHRVLYSERECVAKMQAAGNIRRWQHNTERLCKDSLLSMSTLPMSPSCPITAALSCCARQCSRQPRSTNFGS